jgi:hypothetical protein
MDGCKPLDAGAQIAVKSVRGDRIFWMDPDSLAAGRQGLTLLPISAHLELYCPPYDPTLLMSVSWSCSS